ncbi:MAG TPA: FAD-dependent oxidoreductase [Chloroflexota bacterium]|nr:FAD-dependent oxidoreductase [Chloroflexota bacterium]
MLDPNQMQFEHEADVVVVGAGGAGLPAAISARDHGASVLVVEANHDVGGHAILSGGRIPLGGGTSLQKQHGIEDSPDQVYLDHTQASAPVFRIAERDLVRVWADENAPTMEFLLENGVIFDPDLEPEVVNFGTVPRLFRSVVHSDSLADTIAGRPGSGYARKMEASARKKGVTFLLKHRMTRILREQQFSGRVFGIVAQHEGSEVHIRARKGLIIATGGHTSNVAFRTRLDPRLTEEYQTAGEPWTPQDASGEIAGLDVGAAFQLSGTLAAGPGPVVSKTLHIGCRWGYRNVQWVQESPMFCYAGGCGLTVKNWEDLILVNQVGRRFWNELEDTPNFINAALSNNGNLGKNGRGANGGGPIWAIFDSAAVERERWNPHPPDVDPNGWFFTADSIAGLAERIRNPYQYEPIQPEALEETVTRWNSFVDAGSDPDFKRPEPKFKIDRPPFYAAWSTPILHDSVSGLKINTKAQVVDTRGEVIPGLYCAGESAGGFALHGLPRVIVFGRIAGREAALSTP